MASLFRPAVAGLAATALLLGVACSANTPATTSQPASSSSGANGSATVPAASSAAQPAARSDGSQATEQLVSKTEPAVVRIQTNVGVGTGFIVEADGYIMTNNHVVANASGTGVASQIKVNLNDGSEYTAKVIGTDVRSDLALIKINATNLPTLKIGSDENTFVGQDVIAIGYALDLGNGAGAPTVSRGIISAKNRAINESSGFGGNQVLGSIQTDASINHGNSGGPLLNYSGEVVGVNTAIAPDASTGGIAPGIGFAVGADTVQAVYDQLKATGKVDRGFLGIACFQPVLPANSKQLGVPVADGGVYLPTDAQFNCTTSGGLQATSVPAGPAQQAGIKPGDVIVGIGGTPVRDESELAVALIKHHAGEKVNVDIYRGGKKMSIPVTLGTPPVN